MAVWPMTKFRAKAPRAEGSSQPYHKLPVPLPWHQIHISYHFHTQTRRAMTNLLFLNFVYISSCDPLVSRFLRYYRVLVCRRFNIPRDISLASREHTANRLCPPLAELIDQMFQSPGPPRTTSALFEYTNRKRTCGVRLGKTPDNRL